jgi:hypothetical protein
MTRCEAGGAPLGAPRLSASVVLPPAATFPPAKEEP